MTSLLPSRRIIIFSEKLNKGMSYKEIAGWLNENGYSTVIGQRFRDANTDFIVQKKEISNEKLSLMYPFLLTSFALELTDKDG